MPEPTGTPTPETPATTPAVGTPAPAPTETPSTVPATTTIDYTNIIGPDGKFQDGWKNSMPEELRNELCLDTYTNLPELVKQHVNLNKMIGKNKVVIPTDKSTPADIDAFHAALGRPKTPEEYKMPIPQGMEKYFDEGLMKQARGIFHGMGFNQKQVDALWKFEQSRIADAVKTIDTEEQQEFEEAERAIIEESGEALDEQRHQADLLIAENCPDEAKRRKLLEALNANSLRPYVFNFLAGIQKKYFTEHGGMPAGDGSSGAMTPAMMESKAKELMATPGYVDGTMADNNPEGWKRLTQQITDLYNRAGK